MTVKSKAYTIFYQFYTDDGAKYFLVPQHTEHDSRGNHPSPE